MAKPKETVPPTPDQLKVNAIQAQRLAVLSEQSAKELEGIKHADVAERLRWHLDPHLLLFRKICGRVVKKDPATGVEYPVPHATVHVEDTDCGLVAYSPSGSKYAWYYPIFCRRETLATVKADECGNFCVWIPFWDIDWILRWRKERICFPFIRPSILDVLENVPVLVEDFPPRPGPGPDPELDVARALARIGRLTPSQLADAVGPETAARIAPLATRASFGSSAAEASAALSDTMTLQPPLPAEFRQVDVTPHEQGDERLAAGEKPAGEHHTMDMVRSTLAQRLGLDAARLAEFDLRNVIGPFKRCFTFYVPEWTVVFDVPDITFRVTQDVDGDGDEEVIYSEGFFDVRWDAGAIPPVKLVASGLARESRVCGENPPVRCGNVPDIQFAGMMPLTAPYVGLTTSGYGRRPNRPRPLPPPMDPQETATAPFCDNVNLFGCLIRAGATKYRLVYRFSGDGGATFSPVDEVPFTGAEWWWHPVGGPPVLATADSNGWYDLPPAGLAGPEVNFLFPFRTPAYANGLYEIRLQMGTGGSSGTASSNRVRLRIDNSAPVYTRTIYWRRVGALGPPNLLTDDCPVVFRGTSRQDVEFDVRWEISANHYRDSAISAWGCGGGDFGAPTQPGSTTPADTSDWHQGPLDNSVVYHARYVLPASVAQGTYNFGMSANTRAFNPAGADAQYQARDWFHDSGTGGRHISPTVSFSVINADS